jgi:hypothetical protein
MAFFLGMMQYAPKHVGEFCKNIYINILFIMYIICNIEEQVVNIFVRQPFV